MIGGAGVYMGSVDEFYGSMMEFFVFFGPLVTVS